MPVGAASPRQVPIADAQRVKGLAPLACKTDKIDSQVLAVLSQRDLVPAIWLPDPRIREERELALGQLHRLLGPDLSLWLTAVPAAGDVLVIAGRSAQMAHCHGQRPFRPLSSAS